MIEKKYIQSNMDLTQKCQNSPSETKATDAVIPRISPFDCTQYVFVKITVYTLSIYCKFCIVDAMLYNLFLF